jgi:hypothetical protein
VETDVAQAVMRAPIAGTALRIHAQVEGTGGCYGIPEMGGSHPMEAEINWLARHRADEAGPVVHPHQLERRLRVNPQRRHHSYGLAPKYGSGR